MSKQVDARSFFATHAVFTAEAFGEALRLERRARDSLLAYHHGRGHLLRVRRGLYWVVPPGADPATCAVDPFLVASRMAEDAVLAYHTALEFHGRAYSVFREVQYQSARAVRPLRFRDWQFRALRFPATLLAMEQAMYGVEERDRAGQWLRVASLERTLVDVLDRPDLGGGWEELWRSLEMVAFFDLDEVLAYAGLLGNATTVAKVGWFLQLHREQWMVDGRHLDALRRLGPRQPRYLDRDAPGPSRMLAEWNLIVPQALAEQRWEALA